jgi:ABC-type sugar transport system ATPase subunit
VAGTATYSLRLEDVLVERAVLGPVSFSVPPGGTVVVAGESGFGGTTLARVVAGTVSSDAGRIFVDDHDVTDTEPAQRRTVGYLPAGGGLLPNLDIDSSIRYGLRLRGEAGPWLENRIRSVVRALDLEPSLKLRPHQLSPGGRFRAAIARIAVRDPAPVVWVVDATRGGHVRGLRETLARVLPDRPDERPGVLVCVDDSRAPVVTGEADRLLVVSDGKITRSGTPGELRADPPDLLTARLALPPPLPVHTGQVGSGEIRCGPMLLPSPPWLRLGRKVSVGVPRTALSLCLRSDPGKGSVVADVEGTVVDVKPEGARAWVIVQPRCAPEDRWWVEHRGDGGWPRPQWRVADPGEAQKAGAPAVSGDRDSAALVGVRVDPGGLLFFDVMSGERIRPG